MTSFKWNDQEVHNPWLQGLLAVFVATMLVGAVAVVMLYIGVLMVTWPIWLPLDWLLKRSGKRGFVTSDGERFAIKWDAGAFR